MSETKKTLPKDLVIVGDNFNEGKVLLVGKPEVVKPTKEEQEKTDKRVSGILKSLGIEQEDSKVKES